MCDLIRSRLIAWMDDELRDGEAQAVSLHVSECDQCSEAVRRIEALSVNIREYCAAAGSPQVRRPWWWIPATAAALVVLAAGLVSTRATRPPAVTVSQVAPVAHASIANARPASRPPTPRRTRRSPKRRITVQPAGREPGFVVVIPIDALLPVGAAPPGAVLVGNLTFDDRGLPGRLRLE